jgi:hypothetical protein
VNIKVHIERLVLDGIEVLPHQQPVLQAAVEGELVRLLADGRVAPGLLNGGALASVPGGAVKLAGDGDPARLGRQIARAVQGGIGE